MPRVCLVQSLTVAVIANMPSAHDEKDPPYQQDIRYVFKLNKWILGSIGIWPVSEQGFGRHASKIAIALGNLTLSFAMVPFALHIVYDEKDIIMRLKLSGLLAFCIVSMTKYCILAIRRPKIQQCIEYVKNDWWKVTFKSNRELMLKYATIGRNLTIISASFMYTAGIIYFMILIPFFSETKINNQTVRPLVYPIYNAFYQSQISPIYEIVYVAHCLCGYTTYSITVGACGLAAVFVTHACGQIHMILLQLEDLLNGENSDIHQRIAIIVKDHVRVMRFSAVIEEILQEVCLVEFSSSVCTICLLEYYCIVSSQIGSVCFMINWYQLSPKSVRSLIMIIAISSNPIKLSAGRMVDLSLTTFGNVLKTSVAYLSFLRTLVM
ncbi:odorant receptor 13a isoform X2 [Monomorium pharaonis]|uniref:odorant receptor 13a isoform X2 n=1 Tax=Monomorium pharaonis TaxID=307658 RepID=UPI001746F648|nr:odorant receptor 13a isoform X2 [Monomorium pharaonis]